MRRPSALLLVLSLIVFANAALAVDVHWNGPNTNFSNPEVLIPGVAGLTRVAAIQGSLLGGLFNSETEGSYTNFVSPAGTSWAASNLNGNGAIAYRDGSLLSGCCLVFADWKTAFSGGVFALPANILNRPAVLRLDGAGPGRDDIYTDIMFTEWGNPFGPLFFPPHFAGIHSTIPVPAALPLLLSALAGFGFVARRKRT